MCEGTGPDITRAIMCGLDDVNEKIRAHVINWLPSKKKFVTILWIFNALLSHACGQNLGEYFFFQFPKFSCMASAWNSGQSSYFQGLPNRYCLASNYRQTAFK